MFKKFIIMSLYFIFLFNIKVFSDCPPLDSCIKVPLPDIFYSVPQPGCLSLCAYMVHYYQCLPSGAFVIDSIVADTNNHPCCEGSATNSPIISYDILREAAKMISQTAGSGSFSIFLPDKCWKWEGTLGPHGIHNAVLVPCDEGISCCEFIFDVIDGVATLRHSQSWGVNTCKPEDACMQICY